MTSNKKTWRVIGITTLVIVGLAAAAVVVYVGMILSAMGLFDKTYDAADLITNFNNKRTEIYAVKSYMNSIVPPHKNVAIEFDGDNEIARLDIIPVDGGRGSDLTGFSEWHLKIGSKKVDSLMKILKWDKYVLTSLKRKLDDANCISIESGEPSKVGFQRSGMGMYFFNVFDKSIQDSVRRLYNDSCIYIQASDKLILEYGGGTIGPQCFPRPTPTLKSP